MFRRVGVWAICSAEILILATLILTARFANYQDVFIAGNIYFTDADCYARMTRVRMCSQDPGLIVRHHDFENFPRGTSPHTTAPLDYFILALSILLRPFTAHAIDLAGALISPLFALAGGLFLWWWAGHMRLRYRWAILIFYAISPILVHASALGRPDHQSLSMLLVTIAICAEWALHGNAENTPAPTTRRWSIVSGLAWGFAMWVSIYEPLVLLFLLLLLDLLRKLHHPNASESGATSALFTKHRRAGWIVFGAIIALAFMIERRMPASPLFVSSEIFKNWSRSIGELLWVSPLNPIWFRWTGFLIIAAPFLIWFEVRASKKSNRKFQSLPIFMLALLVATYFLTVWQARWAYFFVTVFALALIGLLEPVKWRFAVWVGFFLTMYPIFRDWDERLWPNEVEFTRRTEARREAGELRELAHNLMSSELHPFLAPWWLSPSIAYWSGQPGAGGSSHESLEGIVDSARFYLAADWQKAREILENHRISWIFAYDSDRVGANSAILLNIGIPEYAICRIIDRTPAQAPRFLVFSAQNGTGKLFRVANNR